MANNRELSQFANVVGYNGGNIGIATDNPTERLHLIGGSSSSAGTQVDIMRLVASDFSPTNSGGLTIGAVWHNTDVSRRISYLQSSQNLNSGSTNRALCLNPNGGNIGIATDDPNRLLHLKAASSTAYSGGSDTADYNFLKIENTTDDKSAGVFFLIGSNGEAAITATEVADGNTDICFQNRGGGTRSEKVRIDSGGRLQVGRSASDSSDSLLIVQGNAGDSGTGGQISIQRGGNANPTAPSDLGGLMFKDSAGSRGAVIAATCDGDWASNDYPTRLEFKVTADGDSSPTEVVRIASDGQTTFDKGAPGGANQVIGRFQAESSRRLDIVWHDSGSLMGFDTPSNHTIVFKTNGTQRLRILSNGNGVQIEPNSSGENRLQFGGNGTRLQNTTAGGHIDLYTNNAVRNRFLYNGQGTEFSNQNRVIPTTDNAVDLGASGARWDDVYATNGTIQTSDSRLKREVETSVLGIDFVKALRPVSYKWIEGKKVSIVDGTDENGENIYRTDADGNWVYESRDGARRHWGFIAQEVKQVVDDANVDFAGWSLADKDDSNSTQSLRYEEFIAPLTKALQEAIAKIETLETQNADLLARVTALEGS